MSQRLAFILSIALTAFVLVVAGAVAGRVTQAAEPAAEQPEAAAEIEPAAAGPAAADPAAVEPAAALPASPQEREAAYQELINQANQRLEAAYEQLRAQQAAEQAAADPAAGLAQLTPEQAAQLALQVAPGAFVIRPSQLVNFQGRAAYEVTLDLGLVYIDAQTGEILFDGTIVPPGSIGSGGPRNRGFNEAQGSESSLGSDDDDNQSGDDDHGDDDHDDDHGDDHGDDDHEDDEPEGGESEGG